MITILHIFPSLIFYGFICVLSQCVINHFLINLSTSIVCRFPEGKMQESIPSIPTAYHKVRCKRHSKIHEKPEWMNYSQYFCEERVIHTITILNTISKINSFNLSSVFLLK